MIPRLNATVLVVAVLLCTPLQAATYYVATNGDDTLNSGALGSPFASINKAQAVANAGDTVFVRGGVYSYSGTTGGQNVVLFNKSGTAANPINFFNYPGETPTFDFFNYTPQQRIRGFSVQANFLHFKGLELRGVRQTILNVNESWAIRVESGSNNVFEQLNLHDNNGPGLFIQGGANNLVLNCDSHHNYDPANSGGNSDGFGGHSTGAGNMFVGCRAWANSDDGFDFINSPGQETVKNSWSFKNGWIPDTNTAAGNGAGFKAGGFGLDPTKFPAVIPRHQIIGNVAFSNRVEGFYANHHPGGLDFIGNTAFSSGRDFDLNHDQGAADHYLRNNLAFGGTLLSNFDATQVDSLFNSWDALTGVSLSNADFLSLIATGMEGPRLADGSLPYLNFLRLAANSDLIDKGIDLGYPFNGLAPDLGAFEVPEPATLSLLAGTILLSLRRKSRIPKPE